MGDVSDGIYSLISDRRLDVGIEADTVEKQRSL